MVVGHSVQLGLVGGFSGVAIAVEDDDEVIMVEDDEERTPAIENGKIRPRTGTSKLSGAQHLRGGDN
ncbi:hypothetical protein HPP92_008374 [Vanilla planifolia]|uniref:Uncharacterized protein n=1 Tax=Vanilla planifolia TaxID=51239 RepID=A0A835R2J5_VANPL|nr:hypothetical protein HPP92_008374 [Vanilla planifolia]